MFVPTINYTNKGVEMSVREKIKLIKSVIAYKEKALDVIRGSNRDGDYTVLMYEIGGMQNALDAYERHQDVDSRIKQYLGSRPKIHTRAFVMGMYFVAKVIQ